MRTAKILSYFSYFMVIFGLYGAFRLFPFGSFKFITVVVASLLGGIVLRLLAIIGQLVYEMRNDSFRVLNSLERSMFQSNALAREMRDILDARRDDKA